MQINEVEMLQHSIHRVLLWGVLACFCLRRCFGFLPHHRSSPVLIGPTCAWAIASAGIWWLRRTL